jgi:hypothetical protein
MAQLWKSMRRVLGMRGVWLINVMRWGVSCKAEADRHEAGKCRCENSLEYFDLIDK